jgi:DNA-binding response OmpR family regulator
MPTPHAPPAASAAVLLVDDRPENLLALEAALEPLVDETGVRVLRAGTAEEALRHILHEDDAIAVVLLDVMMPGTDGLETARLIRARRASEHLPIIFVTALDADRRRATLGYQFGAVDYLTKPLDPDALRAKVRAFLDLHRRRGEDILQERRRYADEVHALREAALRDETALITTIQRIGTALASELDLERIVQLVTDEATVLTGAPGR